MSIVRTTACAAVIVSLFGCATGAQYGANVYHSDQANVASTVQVANIIAITPAKMEVDNASGKKAAQVAGLLAGAALGALIGHGYQASGGGSVGALAGGAAGGLAGSAVADKVLVDAVSITYQRSAANGGAVENTVQVAKLCEFKPGTAQIMTDGHKTRIQPNAICPV